MRYGDVPAQMFLSPISKDSRNKNKFLPHWKVPLLQSSDRINYTLIPGYPKSFGGNVGIVHKLLRFLVNFTKVFLLRCLALAVFVNVFDKVTFDIFFDGNWLTMQLWKIYFSILDTPNCFGTAFANLCVKIRAIEWIWTCLWACSLWVTYNSPITLIARALCFSIPRCFYLFLLL